MGRRVSHSAEETLNLGVAIGQKAPPNAVVALFGELGAGKTTLAKGIVQGASGVAASEVTSPTFVTLNVYSPQSEELKTVYHFDLYRLANLDEFLAQGFEETFFAGGVCCLEWSEKIAPLLPENHVALHLFHHGENARIIKGEIPWLF